MIHKCKQTKHEPLQTLNNLLTSRALKKKTTYACGAHCVNKQDMTYDKHSPPE